MNKVILKVEVTPDEDMGLEVPEDVRDLVEEAIRDSGLENGAHVVVRLEEEES